MEPLNPSGEPLSKGFLSVEPLCGTLGSLVPGLRPLPHPEALLAKLCKLLGNNPLPPEQTTNTCLVAFFRHSCHKGTHPIEHDLAVRGGLVLKLLGLILWGRFF